MPIPGRAAAHQTTAPRPKARRGKALATAPATAAFQVPWPRAPSPPPYRPCSRLGLPRRASRAGKRAALAASSETLGRSASEAMRRSSQAPALRGRTRTHPRSSHTRRDLLRTGPSIHASGQPVLLLQTSARPRDPARGRTQVARPRVETRRATQWHRQPPCDSSRPTSFPWVASRLAPTTFCHLGHNCASRSRNRASRYSAPEPCSSASLVSVRPFRNTGRASISAAHRINLRGAVIMRSTRGTTGCGVTAVVCAECALLALRARELSLRAPTDADDDVLIGRGVRPA